MIVDLTKFIIEPKLSNCYAEKIQTIAQNCLFPNGLARYGYQITRMTVRLGHEKKSMVTPIFSTPNRKLLNSLKILLSSIPKIFSQ